jgi:AraC-like DNA-binding protein
MADYNTITLPGMLRQERFRDLTIGMAGHYERAGGHRMKRDVVAEYQVAYCVEGCGRITCDGRTMPVEKGGVFINIPGHGHDYAASDSDPWTLWWVHFVGEAGARYFDLMRCRPAEPAFRLGMNDRLVDLFKELLRELARPDLHHQVMAVACLHQILATVVALRAGEDNLSGGATLDMDRLRTHIDGHLEGVSLAGLAEYSGLSVPHFIRLFKKQAGYTPFQYVTRRRIALACELLMNHHELNIGEISERVGYDDRHYFSRVFKKTLGVTARDYRAVHGRGVV